jgi:hypothetical protein
MEGSSKESVGLLYVLRKGILQLYQDYHNDMEEDKRELNGSSFWGGWRKQQVEVVAGARISILGR